VFVATTNDQEFLDDPTGNRRFPVVRVVRDADIAGIIAEREQLLGEAACRVAHGACEWADPMARPATWTWWPTRAEETVLDASRANHEISDVWDEHIMKWAASQNAPFALVDAIASLGIIVAKITRVEERRAAASLRRLGYEVYKTDGLNRWRAMPAAKGRKPAPQSLA
jgi:predicted P-loop ATPase